MQKRNIRIYILRKMQLYVYFYFYWNGNFSFITVLTKFFFKSVRSLCFRMKLWASSGYFCKRLSLTYTLIIRTHIYFSTRKLVFFLKSKIDFVFCLSAYSLFLAFWITEFCFRFSSWIEKRSRMCCRMLGRLLMIQFQRLFVWCGNQRYFRFLFIAFETIKFFKSFPC